MRTSRKDVAKLAGVSEQTVSYVLNKSRKFSKEVEDRVHKAVEKLGYKPDMIAKSLVQRRTDSVAFLVHDIANPIFPEMIRGFQERAGEFGFSVYIADALGQNVLSQINDLISRRVDGIYLSLASEHQMQSIIQRLIDCNVKVVVGNRLTAKAHPVCCVEADLKQGMYDAMCFLRDKGHKKIVYLNGLDTETENNDRYFAFMKYHKQLFGTEPVVIQNDPPYETTVEVGSKLTKRLLEQHVDCTAIITTNDLMAYGAMDCIKGSGLHIPEDISVVGFDDIMYSKYIYPPLTTVGYDKREHGRRIFDELYKRIDGDAEASSYCALSTSLVSRATVRDFSVE